MAWLEISLDLPEDADPEALETVLTDAGALAVTLRDAADSPVLEPSPGTTPLWPSVRLIALFDADCDTEKLRAGLRRHFAPSSVPMLRIDPLEDRDWSRAWMDHFRPMRFGRRLWVCPTGQQVDAPGAVVARLDPGLAFGSGTHPTTVLCLEWLDAHAPADMEVVDYGCGSGILGIAALLLGAGRVDAVDNDPQALWATADNARRNHVDDRCHCWAPESLPQARKRPLLMANILARPLISLAPLFARLLETDGRLVLSGLLETQVDTVRTAYAPYFNDFATAEREDWMRLTARRTAQAPIA